MAGCANNQTKSATENSQNPVEFTEERRLNLAKDLPETKIIHSMEELTKLYGELNDPNFPKSAPIPSFDPEKESMILLKPKLKERNFGDIEIIDMKMVDSQLIVVYKEIENWESSENKWNDPILILRVEGKPKRVVLEKQ